MDCKLRIVIEKVDLKTNKVIDRSTVDSFEIHRPEKIIDVGVPLAAPDIAQKIFLSNF